MKWVSLAKFRNSCLLNFVAGLTLMSVVALRWGKHLCFLVIFSFWRSHRCNFEKSGDHCNHPLNVWKFSLFSWLWLKFSGFLFSLCGVIASTDKLYIINHVCLESLPSFWNSTFESSDLYLLLENPYIPFQPSSSSVNLAKKELPNSSYLCILTFLEVKCFSLS